MESTITAWITRYALSNGIYSAEVEISDLHPEMVSVVGNVHQTFHGEGRDWHRTAEGARTQAEALRRKKIISLKRQIAKLEKLTF